LSSKAFLHGTTLPTVTRVSDTQSIKLDVTALDPAFEKAIRAVGEIAQGGLIDHPERVKQALATINDAIHHSPLEPTEAQSDLQSIQDRIANNMVTIKNTKDIQNDFLAFLEGRQNDLSKINTTEAAVRLQTDSQSLQISFASIAKISQLSLLNYL
jgi:flagellar hook-associated protein 3 FlgL